MPNYEEEAKKLRAKYAEAITAIEKSMQELQPGRANLVEIGKTRRVAERNRAMAIAACGIVLTWMRAFDVELIARDFDAMVKPLAPPQETPRNA